MYIRDRQSDLACWVNLKDYLDTGLFLDHRTTRQLLASKAKNRDFLNLFAYTGTATVYAAAGLAKSTTTVDMSNTYLSWAKENMLLNNFKQAHHQFIRANCLKWLHTAQQAKQRYGLIFLDPPTFSNSSQMDSAFDLQRDYISLINLTAGLLDEDGDLFFSTNRRNFKMEPQLLTGLTVNNISHKTLPTDFKRNPKIHTCWHIRKNVEASLKGIHFVGL